MRACGGSFPRVAAKVLTIPHILARTAKLSAPAVSQTGGVLCGQAGRQLVTCSCIVPAGVLGIVPLECEDGGKRTVSQLCCHSGELGVCWPWTGLSPCLPCALCETVWRGSGAES